MLGYRIPSHFKCVVAPSAAFGVPFAVLCYFHFIMGSGSVVQMAIIGALAAGADSWRSRQRVDYLH